MFSMTRCPSDIRIQPLLSDLWLRPLEYYTRIRALYMFPHKNPSTASIGNSATLFIYSSNGPMKIGKRLQTLQMQRRLFPQKTFLKKSSVIMITWLTNGLLYARGY